MTSVCRNVAVVAFPALQCVVFDLFIVRPANKSSLGKDLETQQEVVISMLLRLLQHHQVVSMVLGDWHMSSVLLHCDVMWYRKAKDLGDAVPNCYQERCAQDWCFRSLGVCESYQVSNGTTMLGMMSWDGQPGNHTFQLLSKHNVSLCSATLHECQMKQMLRS